MAKVLARYKGKVQFVHRDFLLGRPRSLAVARAALCAGDQGKFWEYHHDLLTTPGRLERPGPRRRARPRWASTPATFQACLASDRHDKPILAVHRGRAAARA